MAQRFNLLRHRRNPHVRLVGFLAERADVVADVVHRERLVRHGLARGRRLLVDFRVRRLQRVLQTADQLLQLLLLLLEQADKKLLEIAQSVGYESDAAFSKSFKRVLGVSPGEYRRNGNNILHRC